MSITLEALAQEVEQLKQEVEMIKERIQQGQRGKSLEQRTAEAKKWLSSLPPIDETSCLFRLAGRFQRPADLSDKHKHGV